MQIFIRYAVLACVIALPLNRAAAQSITITEDDVRQQMEVGKFTTTVSDTLTKLVNIGSTGATSWDFSGLLTHTSTTLTSVTPSSTPYISFYPDATFALQTVMSVAGITGTAYVYLVLDTNLMNPGIMAGTSSFLGPIVYHRSHVPSDITYALPSTFGTTWTSVYTSSEVITLNGSPISTTSNNHNASYEVDAYGPMTLPGGLVEDALRIRKYDSTSTWKAVSFIFLAKSGASVQLSPAESFPPDTGIIAVTSVTWNGPLPTGIEVAPGIPTDLVLRQNFPNPFNPSTEIRFSVPASRNDHAQAEVPGEGRVTLKVYDLLGREVASLVDEEKEPGTYSVTFNAAGLASGVYVYRLSAGGTALARRMLITK